MYHVIVQSTTTRYTEYKIIYSNLGFSTVNHIDTTQPRESYIPNYQFPIISPIIYQEPHPYLGLKVALRILDRSNFSQFYASLCSSVPKFTFASTDNKSPNSYYY